MIKLVQCVNASKCALACTAKVPHENLKEQECTMAHGYNGIGILFGEKLECHCMPTNSKEQPYNIKFKQ